MSSTDFEAEANQQKGPEVFLSAEERQALQRNLGFPEDLPSAFKSWLVDYMAVNIAQVPLSQIVGFDLYADALREAQDAIVANQISVYSGNVGTTIGLGSASYATFDGPLLTGLPGGQYVVQFGCYIDADGDKRGYMSLSVNGGAASDADSASAGVDGLPGDQVRMSISRGVPKTLPLVTGNTIACQYRTPTGGPCSMSNRWIIATKVSGL